MPLSFSLSVKSSNLQHKNRQYLKNQQTVLSSPYSPCQTVLKFPEIHARQFWIFSAFYSPLGRQGLDWIVRPLGKVIIFRDRQTDKQTSLTGGSNWPFRCTDCRSLDWLTIDLKNNLGLSAWQIACNNDRTIGACASHNPAVSCQEGRPGIGWKFFATLISKVYNSTIVP